MVTTAIDFRAHDRAGLILAGQDEYGTPEWCGTTDKWARIAEEQRRIELDVKLRRLWKD